MLFLHIGVGKAGSTTIQSFLKEKRELLDAHVAQLDCVGIGHGWKLAAASGTDLAEKYWVRNREFSSHYDYRDFVSKFWDNLRSEVDHKGSNNYVISSEHIFSQYFNYESNIIYLKDKLTEIFGTVRVIFYCRDQISWAKSFYGQIIKGPTAGRLPYDAFVDEFIDHRNHWDYYNNLSVWADIFGDDAIFARVLDKRQLVSGDLIMDFLNLMDLENEKNIQFKSGKSSNISPKYRRLEAVRYLNYLKGRSAIPVPVFNLARRIILNNKLKLLDKGSKFPAHRDKDLLTMIDETNRRFNNRFLKNSAVKLSTFGILNSDD